jgi:hypothetical protein
VEQAMQTLVGAVKADADVHASVVQHQQQDQAAAGQQPGVGNAMGDGLSILVPILPLHSASSPIGAGQHEEVADDEGVVVEPRAQVTGGVQLDEEVENEVEEEEGQDDEQQGGDN